jgi:hypothetical protein
MATFEEPGGNKVMKDQPMLTLREVAYEPELACRREEKLDLSAAWGAIGSLNASAAWGGKKLGKTGVWISSTLRVNSPAWDDATNGVQS